MHGSNFAKFAEVQLSDYGDETLHRFLVDVALTPVVSPDDVKVYTQAWSGLHRWYDSFGFPRRRPVKVSAESIATFFGSPREFLVRFSALVRERPIRTAMAEMLQYPESSALAGIAGSPREAMDAAGALVQVMRDAGVDFLLRLACTDFLSFLGSEASLRDAMVSILESFKGTDLDLQSTRGLERILLTVRPAWN